MASALLTTVEVIVYHDSTRVPFEKNRHKMDQCGNEMMRHSRVRVVLY
jgi:hypothetical protein